MRKDLRNLYGFVVAVFLINMLVTSADAKLLHSNPAKTDRIISQNIDDSWDGDLDSNWGYDYSLNPNEFGQNLNGPNGDFGYGGFGYGYGGW
jgi:hypothetical protein